MAERVKRRIGETWPAALFGVLILAIWQAVSAAGLVPGYMLPGPLRIGAAFAADFPLLMRHLSRTLSEAAAGLALALVFSFVLAVLMDANRFLRNALNPLLLLTQTVPVIALAPLLILWMGYGAAPKITLIFITCFFPLTVGILGAFSHTDEDALRLLKSMGAKRRQIYRYIKIPEALPAFFSGLRISASYSIIGAVISEWLGGEAGLGVYMIRVRKSYSFDRMFAAIFLVAFLSLALIGLVAFIEKICMPWKRTISEGDRS
ncbi:MAG: ABC transporter permease [Treponema sp.]|jgi:ABC-type nitrate/sulfonate/bicarbonate transport system permease component|nr:ABC transporter permease [Treponema sp.]